MRAGWTAKTESQIMNPPSDAAIETAILQTVAYVDVFDYPLTATEVHRYLVGVPASAARVTAVLKNGRLVPRHLSHCQGYFTLPGRESIVATRKRREEVARRLWPEAIRYGRRIGTLPFVRMVALTGSLAVNNAESDADIDYLIVTENGRLWLCRAFTILVVRLAARRGIHLCPNYFLSQQALVFDDRTLYTAHELAQMVPITGLDIYGQLRQLNAWTADFLPNAHHPPQPTFSAPAAPPSRTGTFWRAMGELLLRTPLGTGLERWEMQRKIRKFSHQNARLSDPEATEAAFSADWCKGHFESHGRQIMDTFSKRLQTVKDSDETETT